MVEARGGAGFVEKHPLQLAKVGSASLNLLDHGPVNEPVLGYFSADVELGHRAPADPRNQLVIAYSTGNRTETAWALKAVVFRRIHLVQVVGRVRVPGARTGHVLGRAWAGHIKERTRSRIGSQRDNLRLFCPAIGPLGAFI